MEGAEIGWADGYVWCAEWCVAFTSLTVLLLHHFAPHCETVRGENVQEYSCSISFSSLKERDQRTGAVQEYT